MVNGDDIAGFIVPRDNTVICTSRPDDIFTGAKGEDTVGVVNEGFAFRALDRPDLNCVILRACPNAAATKSHIGDRFFVRFNDPKLFERNGVKDDNIDVAAYPNILTDIDDASSRKFGGKRKVFE